MKAKVEVKAKGKPEKPDKPNRLNRPNQRDKILMKKYEITKVYSAEGREDVMCDV